ncbi:MAG: restriction endonuclease subunit S [Balneola sp.]|nr:restriction endonuclease subunit S [Balneola sp.]
MSEDKINPEIRLSKYSEDWKEFKIGEIFAEKKRPIVLEDDREYELVTVKRRNEGVVPRGHLKGKDILVKNYFQVREGDFVVSKRQVVHGATGIIPKSLDKAIVSNEYLVSAGNEKISSEFWTLLSKLPKMHKKFFLSSYGVDIEKLVFDVDDWKKRTIIVPSLKEQKDIISLFDSLEQQLENHKQKYNKLSFLKKAMLEKMFPLSEKDVPDIRFSGFKGHWEKKKLVEIGDLKSNGVNKKSSYDENPVYLLNYTDVFNSREITPENIQKLMEVTASHSQIIDCNIQKNDIFFTPTSETPEDIGRVLVIEYDLPDTVFSYHLVRLRPKEGVLFSNFPNYAFASKYVRKQLVFAAQGVQRYVINKPAFEQISTLVPSLDEQKQIAYFFRNIDKQISLQIKHIKKLKLIRKACLNKMTK